MTSIEYFELFGGPWMANQGLYGLVVEVGVVTDKNEIGGGVETLNQIFTETLV